MTPHAAHLPTLDPRRLLSEQGEAALADLLRATGYVVQANMLRDLAHVLRSGLPWLIEGPRGGGKTALAEALAQACNLPLFYLQGMEGLTLADVLYGWDGEAQTQWVRQSLAAGQGFHDARQGQWTREFLKLGEALAAYEYAANHKTIPILICDEFDKVSEKLEDMLLQLFARGVAHVPRYGEIGVKDQSRWPVVILLSNDQRHDLSAPLRSRCLYSWLAPPTAREEVRILNARCPNTSPGMLLAMVKLIHGIRSLPGILDKPGLRESIAFLQALRAEGCAEITEDVIAEHLCFLAKRHLDLENLRKSLARLAQLLAAPNPELESWVEEFTEVCV
jgi:MoxR-like ATPase